MKFRAMPTVSVAIYLLVGLVIMVKRFDYYGQVDALYGMAVYYFLGLLIFCGGLYLRNKDHYKKAVSWLMIIVSITDLVVLFLHAIFPTKAL